MSEKRRVLQVIDGLNVGGAEVLLRDLCAGLLQRGYAVEVGYSTPGPILQDLQALGLQPVRLPRLARIDPLRYGPGLVRLIRNFRPQIVHTHLFKSDFHGWSAAHGCGTPVILSTLHNTDAWARSWLFGRLYGLAARQVSRFIAVSQEVKDYHVRYSHIPAEKITPIANGVDVDRFRHDPAARAQTRAALGLDPDAPVIGIIGRLKPQKDHATFLLATAQIARQLPGARFLIVGDGPLRAELEQQARSLGLGSAVQFCGVRADIPALLSALDVLVLSSRWEGLPITLLEGMAASRAIVSTAVSGILDVVLRDETALLVEPGDPGAIAAACLGLLANAPLREQLGQNALRRVRSAFSMQAMFDQTFAVYEAALAAANREEGA